jgi:hypothetical protein
MNSSLREPGPKRPRVVKMAACRSVLARDDKPGAAVDELTSRFEMSGMTCGLANQVQDDLAHVVEPPVRPALDRPPGSDQVFALYREASQGQPQATSRRSLEFRSVIRGPTRRLNL